MTALLGLNKELPMATYRAHPAFGSSDLKAFRLGPPARVLWQRQHPEETDSTKLGTATHMALLEPDLFNASYVQKPAGMNFATKEGKEWKAGVPEGQIILSRSEWDVVQGACDAFDAKDVASKSLHAAVAVEGSLFWIDPDTGIPLKARPDWFDAGYVYELKLTRHATTAGIAFHAWAKGWMHQLAHIRDGLVACGFKVRGGRIVAIHPKAPHYVVCAEVKEDALSLLSLENGRTLADMAKCIKANDWPGTPNDWSLIDLPPVAFRDIPIWPSEDGTDLHPLT